MQARWVEFLQDVLITIHENIRELKERKTFADPEELTHIEAKLLTYHEVLSALRSSAREFNLDYALKKFGINWLIYLFVQNNDWRISMMGNPISHFKSWQS